MAKLYSLTAIRTRRRKEKDTEAGGIPASAVVPTKLGHCLGCDLPGYAGRECNGCGDMVRDEVDRPLWCVIAEQQRRDELERYDRDTNPWVAGIAAMLLLVIASALLVIKLGLH